MNISIIVAASENGVIGRSGRIPWRLPADLARFKQLTMGHPIIMGRKTHESIGRPLPGRYNIVITHSPGLRPEGVATAGSLDEALSKAAKAKGSDEIFVIGGAQIYEAALARTDRIYLTRVKSSVRGDTYFKFNPADWIQVSCEKHPPDKDNAYPYEFCLLERIR